MPDCVAACREDVQKYEEPGELRVWRKGIYSNGLVTLLAETPLPPSIPSVGKALCWRFKRSIFVHVCIEVDGTVPFQCLSSKVGPTGLARLYGLFDKPSSTWPN